MNASKLQKGERVIVDLGEVRGQKEAVVEEEAPVEGPFGEEQEGKMLVVYPGSGPDRQLVGDLGERVSVDDVVEKL